VVRVEPSGIELETEPDEAIMSAARRQGYRWPTVCGGHGECTVCFVEVVAGGEHLSAPAADEQRQLDVLGRSTFYAGRHLRLACQARCREGRVVVQKRGVRLETPDHDRGV
jgi:ferredoxin, 2Fe-2S